MNKRMNGRERQLTEYLYAVDAKMTQFDDTLKERLQEIPNGWRQYRLVQSTLHRLLWQLLGRLEPRDEVHFNLLHDKGEMLIRMQSFTRVPEMTYISDVSLEEIIRAAMAGECAMCLREGREIDKCALRRALWDVVPPEEERVTSCGYKDVALSDSLKR